MARTFISILQDFYPERLGCAVLLSIPWIVRKFLDIAFTFVDPITKAKVRWHVDVVKEGLVGPDQALREYGGNVDVRSPAAPLFYPLSFLLTHTFLNSSYTNKKTTGHSSSPPRSLNGSNT